MLAACEFVSSVLLYRPRQASSSVRDDSGLTGYGNFFFGTQQRIDLQHRHRTHFFIGEFKPLRLDRFVDMPRSRLL
jgi:hypothetical protein